MIWGMTLHPGVEYTREIMSKEYFTLASLDCRTRMIKGEYNPIAHVLMKIDNRETVLCTLEKGVVNQQGLNFLLQAGDHLTLSVEGTGIVYISGYTVSCPQISDDIHNDRSTSSPLVRCTTEPDETAENFTPDHPTYTSTEGSLPLIVEGSVTHIKTELVESDAIDDNEKDKNVTNQELSELEDEVMARTEGSVTHIKTELVESDAIDDNEKDKNVTNQRHKELEDEVMVRTEGNVTYTETDSLESVAMDEIQENVANQELSELEDEVMARTELKEDHPHTRAEIVDVVERQDEDELSTERAGFQNSLIKSVCATKCSPTKPNSHNYGDLYPLVGLTQLKLIQLKTDEAVTIPNISIPISQPESGQADMSEVILRPEIVSCQENTAKTCHPPDTLRDSNVNDSQDNDCLINKGASHEDHQEGLLQQCCRRRGNRKRVVRKCLQSAERSNSAKGIAKCNIRQEESSNMPTNKSESKPQAMERTQKRKSRYHGTMCLRTFSEKSNFSQHRKLCHTSESNQFESKLNKPTKTSDIHQFSKQTSAKTFLCQYCAKSFSHKFKLIIHERIHTSKIPFKCQFCEKSFPQNSALTSHERTHTGEKPFNCQLCEKSFARKSHLICHKRTHTGEKPFKCQLCEKSFAGKGNLIRHKRIHTGEKPFKCQFCEKLFAVKPNVRLHERIHTGEKPFKCQLCEKSFAHKGSWIYHKRSHTGERPFKCQVCEKSFAQKGALTYHERTHTGEKPFKCQVCEKSFAQKGALTCHERIHTGEKPFKCQFCEKSFAHKCNWVNHKRNHTGEKAI